MRWGWLILLIPALLAAQPFEWVQELDSIPVVVDGYAVPEPWLGGYADTAPELADIDADGDSDFLLANSTGWVAFFANTGTPSSPCWSITDQHFQDINGYTEANCQFVDMDADGALDCFIDGGNIFLKYYQNVGSATAPLFLLAEDTVRDVLGNYIDGTEFGLADIDADGDQDFFAGTWYTGKIKFYQNIGDSAQFAFLLADSNFAGIIVGQASPTFCDIDADGDLDLFIGSNGGWICHYRNDGTPQEYSYTFITYQWMGIDVAEKASPEFCDIDGDGDFDLFIGKENDNSHTIPGDVHFWRNDGTPQVPQMVQESQMYLTLDFEDGTEPGILDVNFDGKADLFVHSYYIGWLKNVGTVQNPVFELQSYNVAGTGFLASSTGFGDLNGDSHQDMVVVYGWSGNVEFWINNGDTLNPQFSYFSGFSIGQLAGGPELADMDGDGDNDLIVDVSSMQFDPYIYYYENQGDPQHFNFVLTATNYQGWADYYDIYAVVDFDGDGDFDVIAEFDSTNTMTYLQNVGSPQNASFASGYSNFIPVDPFDFKTCDFCDVDNDGDMDAFFGSILGGIKFYRNVTGEASAPPPVQQHPRAGLQISLGPNPANPFVAASFELRVASNMSLEVYDLLGRRVAELASGFHLPGEYRYVWDASGKAAGVYILRLKTGRETVGEKMVILK